MKNENLIDVTGWLKGEVKYDMDAIDLLDILINQPFIHFGEVVNPPVEKRWQLVKEVVQLLIEGRK